jgi:phosphoglycerate dehydrogenase-like enzyme
VGALRSGQLAGTGLDVVASEPLPPGHPLRVRPPVRAYASTASTATAHPARPFTRPCISPSNPPGSACRPVAD